MVKVGACAWEIVQENGQDPAKMGFWRGLPALAGGVRARGCVMGLMG